MLKLILLCSLMPLLALGWCPTIIGRSQWGARSPRGSSRTSGTPSFVVVHHSETPECSTTSQCKNQVKNIQDWHMDREGWEDIGYNFLIGGDGNVYEGRGWGISGAHTPGYNSRSIGVCVIGNFQNTSPSNNQLQALKDLISCAEDNGYLSSNYHLIGHRQGGTNRGSTTCPGDRLYDEISRWPNHDSSIRP